MGKLLKKVAESAVKQDKNGKNYKTITFQTIGTQMQNVPGVGNVRVSVPTKTSSMNVYEESYLNGKEEFGYSLPVGEYVTGDIVTRTVEPYSITDTNSGEVRTVNTYTAIVLGDTDAPDFEVLVERTLSRRLSAPVLAD